MPSPQLEICVGKTLFLLLPGTLFTKPTTTLLDAFRHAIFLPETALSKCLTLSSPFISVSYTYL